MSYIDYQYDFYRRLLGYVERQTVALEKIERHLVEIVRIKLDGDKKIADD